jgi:uncharacterized phage-associated protein
MTTMITPVPKKPDHKALFSLLASNERPFDTDALAASESTDDVDRVKRAAVSTDPMVDNVANGIFQYLERVPLTVWEVQKLSYYAQAWKLAWYGAPMYQAPVMRYKDGPCIKQLETVHGDVRYLNLWPRGDHNRLNAYDELVLRAVLSHYGHMSGKALRTLTHSEAPWKETTANAIISHDDMERFYRSQYEAATSDS